MSEYGHDEFEQARDRLLVALAPMLHIIGSDLNVVMTRLDECAPNVIRDASAEGRFLKAMAYNCGSNVPCSECGCDLYDAYLKLCRSLDSRKRRSATYITTLEADIAALVAVAKAGGLAVDAALMSDTDYAKIHDLKDALSELPDHIKEAMSIG